MTSASQAHPRVENELDVLEALVPLDGQDIVELGCGAAVLARALLRRHPDSRVTGIEVDERQHAKNLASPQPGLRFLAGVAQAVPCPDATFDLALMLKSLHHVPIDAMAQALDEAWRVLRPGGRLYVSEPVYAGALNDVIRLFNEERVVRAAAQAALDGALATGRWEQMAERRFELPAHYADFADFERQSIGVTFADRHLDAAQLAAVRAAFEAHMGPDGADFTRPMHVRLLRRRG